MPSSSRRSGASTRSRGDRPHLDVDNFQTLWKSSAYRTIALRTIGIAAAVTVTDALLAFPFAFFMARIGRRRAARAFLFVAVLLPLWSSYLVRVYVWRLILRPGRRAQLDARQGRHRPARASATRTGRCGSSSRYVWLPFMILPVSARSSGSPTRTSRRRADLGARGSATFRRVVLPLALPGVVAGSIFTFSLTLGDYITPTLVGGAGSQFIGNVVYDYVGIVEQRAVRGGLRDGAARRDGHLPPDRRAGSARSRRCDGDGRHDRIALAVWTALVVLFLWVPLALIMVYAFNKSNVQSWPIPGFTTQWFRVAWHNAGGARRRSGCRCASALIATAIAIVLGSMAAFAVAPLPLLRPRGGLVPARAADRAARDHHRHGPELVLQRSGQHQPRRCWTIVIGHATFCVVIVYNNVLARLRRTSASLIEASMDLGADGWQTFRFVTLPMLVDGARRRRPARLRAVVRRGRRDVRSPPARRTRCRC